MGLEYELKGSSLCLKAGDFSFCLDRVCDGCRAQLLLGSRCQGHLLCSQASHSQLMSATWETPGHSLAIDTAVRTALPPSPSRCWGQGLVVGSGQTFCLWLIFASKDQYQWLFLDVMVVFKVFIANYSAKTLMCSAKRGRSCVLHCSLWWWMSSLIQAGYCFWYHCLFCPTCTALGFCSFGEQSLVPSLVCGFSVH